MDDLLYEEIRDSLTRAKDFLLYAEEVLRDEDMDFWADKAEKVLIDLDKLIDSFEGEN